MKKMEGEETIYGILLDVQKQIGFLSRETGEQTEIIKAVREQTTKTNGRVNKLEEKTEALEKQQENWNGRIAVLSVFGGAMVTLIIAFIKKKLGI